MQSITQHTPRQHNNFSLIRLFAAALVIVSHAYGFCGKRDPIFLFTGSLTGGILAVQIFFTISGYLVSDSWLRRPELIAYFKKRILRIYPALIVVIFLSVFVFGPLMTTLSARDYFSDKSVYTYFINLTLWKMQFYLPGIFVGGYPNVFNAPLWTLFFEFAMYVTIPVFAFAGLLNKDSNRIWILWIIFGILLGLELYVIPESLIVLKINAFYFTRFFLYFYAGVLFRLYSKDNKMHVAFLILSLTGFVLTRGTTFFGLFSILSVTTFVFWFAFIKWNPLQFMVKDRDYSYGLYLYGYIVQINIQNLLQCSLPLAILIPLTLLITFVFAFMSWHWVEKRVLSLKNRV